MSRNHPGRNRFPAIALSSKNKSPRLKSPGLLRRMADISLMRSSARPSPRVRPPTENHEAAQDYQRGSSSPATYMRADGPIGERLMVKEESAASVGTRPWMPEGRSLTLSIAFML
ncbi:hypothetical protein AVEN_192399-1 [Araneus ventricosus]|uniref:Uncharacterized protein n=1 Tax=Araneus ventricosus TaxID=182803 RepID=A0A4Y2H884_ARAVE|nr:hypothetical protein AVEN_192399-1 [Araneus ventricosus]